MNRRPFWVPTVGGIDYKIRPHPFYGRGPLSADEELLVSVTDVDVDGYRSAGLRLVIVGLRVSKKPETAIPITGRRPA